MTTIRTINENDWRLELIAVGDRTLRVTHVSSGTVAVGRDEADAWMAIALALGDRLAPRPKAQILDVDVEAKRLAIAIARSPEPGRLGRHTAEAFRKMWNTRGAVEIATIETELSTMMGATKAGPYLKNHDRALRALDR
jgi:hypothetical protein